MSITRLHTGPRMSQVVVHGQTVYLAGQVADQAKGKSVGEQTKEILATVDRLLAEAGSDRTRILVSHDLSRRHWDFRRDERRMGRLDPRGPHARARNGRGQARRPGLYGRDRLHRREGLIGLVRPDSLNSRERSDVAPIPSSESARGPFEQVRTPSEAVDRLAQLYSEATQALRSAVERYLKDGEPPSTATRSLFRYPELRLTYKPNGAAPPNARAYAKFSEPGLYTTTVTQPEDFRAYLLEQLQPLASEYGALIEVGVGAQEIPYPYVIESGDELTRGGADAAGLARYFPSPSLATIGDETADGEFVHGDERPLALFDAPRVRLLASPARALYRLRLASDAALGAAHQLPPLRRPVFPVGA